MGYGSSSKVASDSANYGDMATALANFLQQYPGATDDPQFKEFLGSAINTIGDSSLGGQLQQTLDVAYKNAPDQYAAYNDYSNKYDTTDINRWNNIIGGLSPINQQLAAQVRQFNPELYSSLDRYNQFSQNPIQQQGLSGTYNQLQGMFKNGSPIRNTLTQQAQDQLALGGNLSGQELRDVQQSSRTASEARGLSGSNSSLISEAMNTDAMRRQRLNERQAFAQGVDSNNFGQDMALGGALLGQENANNQYNLGVSGFNRDTLQNLAGLYGSSAYDPTALTFNAGQNLVGQNSSLVNGMFSPYNSYAQDYYNTQLNAKASANNSAANNSAAKSAATTGALASVGGALIVAF